MYTYTVGGKGGKKVNLQESDDRVVVRTRNARKLEDAVASKESKAVLKEFDIEMEYPDADVTVLKAKKPKRTKKARASDTKAFEPVLESKANKIEQRDNARTVLKQEPELRYAGRVLEDEQSKAPVLYTENLFIKFLDDIPAERCEAILLEHNLKIKKKVVYAKNSYFVNAPEGTGLEVFPLSQKLLEKPEVEFCHPEVLRKKSFKVIHAKQWHLKETKISGKKITAHVNADKAHLITKGENIIIAVIDDGFDIDHPEFSMPGKVVHSRDVTQSRTDPRPLTLSANHGTCCAGVATASGIKASGVAPKAKLMPIRNTSWLGSENEATAFEWAVEHGADIISCSWGPTDGDWWDPDHELHTEHVELSDYTRQAIEYAVNQGRNGKGCVIFFSAGNGREDIRFDGYSGCEHVIAVAASNDDDKQSIYSDFGDAIWCCFPSGDDFFDGDEDFPKIDHPQPHTSGIYTTDRVGRLGDADGDYFDSFSGTSSACPGAAGVAALILSVNPALNWMQVRNIIRDTCIKIDPANGNYVNGHSIKYGYGKVDAHAAVLAARAAMVSPIVTKRVKIASALVDPRGADIGNEILSLRNTSTTDIDLNGWSIEVKGKRQSLSATLATGQTISIKLKKKVKLGNTGSTISLIDNQQQVIDSVSYTEQDARAGVEIQF